MSEQASRVAKRSQQACTSCRQLRCDGRETFPAACSRCKKNNLDCRTDSTFKRVRTRHRLDEVANQLNAIQKTLGICVASSRAGNDTEYPTPSTTLGGMSSSPCDRLLKSATPEDASRYLVGGPSGSAFYRASDINVLPVSPVTLGHVSLDGDQVRELFRHFQHHCYRHCPILDTDMSIDDLHRSSPFLFWTIIIIASKCHHSLYPLYYQVVEPYRMILGSVLMGAILELDLIHGVLLLCFWPLWVQKQIYDPSWNYCGLATNAALKMGLQNSASKGRPEKEKRIRTKTWMACVQVNAIYAWNHGLAMSTEITRGIESLAPPLSPLELDFEAKTALQQQSAKSALIMANVNNTIDSVQFAQTVSNDLEAVKDRYRGTWGDELDIMLLSAQIKLYAFVLQALSQVQKYSYGTDRNLELDISRKALLQCGLTASIRLVHVFSELVDRSGTEHAGTSRSMDDNANTRQCDLLKHIFVALYFATSFIFKNMAFRASELPSSVSDLARNHIRLSYKIFSSSSLVTHDELAQAARTVEFFSRAHDLSLLKKNELSPDSGSGLHLLEDMIIAKRELKKIAPVAAGHMQKQLQPR